MTKMNFTQTNKVQGYVRFGKTLRGNSLPSIFKFCQDSQLRGVGLQGGHHRARPQRLCPQLRRARQLQRGWLRDAAAAARVALPDHLLPALR